MESGVARKPINDVEAYRDSLEARLGKSREVMRMFIHKAQASPKRIVFPEGEEEKILRASQIILDEKIARPILLGREAVIRRKIGDCGLDLDEIEIIDPASSLKFDEYVTTFYNERQRKGTTRFDSERLMKTPNVFGMMMVARNDADGLISGLTQHYPETVRPALQIIGKQDKVQKIAGLYMLVFKNRTLFIADATVNIEPTAEELAEVALLAAEKVKQFDIEPRVALLSFSNFGSTRHPLTDKVRKAVEIVRKRAPRLVVDGEMMADTAIAPEILTDFYPFSSLKESANVLICPDLTSANIAYKLLAHLGGAVAIGPILLGIRKPVYLLGPGNEVADIVNMAAMAVFESSREQESHPEVKQLASRYEVEMA
jgi:malate dehydrogenase (oxaloacetate-decarboxylating)(NADP+)